MSAENIPVYIHERDDWPRFVWNEASLAEPLAAVRYRQGRLLGKMEALGFDLRAEAVLRTLTLDVVKSSEIEGERLDDVQVRSSIARRLGIDIGAPVCCSSSRLNEKFRMDFATRLGAVRSRTGSTTTSRNDVSRRKTPECSSDLRGGTLLVDRHVDGVVEMMLDATQNYRAPLTTQRLFGWHAALFPTGYSGMAKIAVAAWRDDHTGPMQVVSGPIGRQKVHFEAPAAERVPAEMAAFLDWLDGDMSLDPVLKAALAHLWFVTIHPFDDGNGRIARAIADLALARAEASTQRFYSMSAQIQLERDGYYAVLEQTQKGELDVTLWLRWFLACLDRAFDGAEEILASVLRKSRFWDSIAGKPLNARQRKVINRLLDGFEGKLTTTKWAALTKTSADTALRDIGELVALGVLVKDEGGGRNTSYSLASER